MSEPTMKAVTSSRPSVIKSRQVVSAPNAALEVTELVLTELATRGLTTSVTSIPGPVRPSR